MTELKWLDQYSGESTDQLIALETEYRSDSIVLAFEQALDQKSERSGYESLSVEETDILAIEALEREVNNGGYHQFFFNTCYSLGSDYAIHIVNALRRIGHAEAAELTSEAIALLEIDGEITVDAINQVMEKDDDSALLEKLDLLDTRYYETVGDLSVPLLEYIKQNREKIRLD